MFSPIEYWENSIRSKPAEKCPKGLFRSKIALVEGTSDAYIQYFIMGGQYTRKGIYTLINVNPINYQEDSELRRAIYSQVLKDLTNNRKIGFTVKGAETNVSTLISLRQIPAQKGIMLQIAPVLPSHLEPHNPNRYSDGNNRPGIGISDLSILWQAT